MKAFSDFMTEAKSTDEAEQLKASAVSFLKGNGGSNVRVETNGKGFDVESRIGVSGKYPKVKTMTKIMIGKCRRKTRVSK